MIVSRARFVQDRTPNIITFQGTYDSNGRHIAFFDLIDNYVSVSELKTWIERDCRYLKYILACDCVRFVLRPYDPYENNNGFQYPVPSPLEKSNLQLILNTFRENDFDIMIAFVLPERFAYGFRDPDSIDDFYTNNRRKLIDNQIQYINECMEVIGTDYRYIDYFGDFDPLDVYERGIGEEQKKWFSYLKAEFGFCNNWSVEVVGSVDKPISKIAEECRYLLINGISKPHIQIYLDNSNYDFNITDILTSIRDVADCNFLLEEAGTNTTDYTDDGDLGRTYFRKLFQARNAVCPGVPIGLWAWGSHTTPTEWEWSLNRDVWDIRPCWWYIQEGASGIMWDLVEQKVLATRKQSNFIVFKELPARASITLHRTCGWNNHIKDGEIYIGQWDKPISENLAINEWWPKGKSHRTIDLPDLPGLELWVSVDFNWIDPNLFAKVDVEV